MFSRFDFQCRLAYCKKCPSPLYKNLLLADTETLAELYDTGAAIIASNGHKTPLLVDLNIKVTVHHIQKRVGVEIYTLQGGGSSSNN